VTGELGGQTALITGAAQGLGLAISQAYVSAGARIVMCDRDLDRLEQAAKGVAALAAAGEVVGIHGADVSDPAAVDGLVSRVLSLLPELDILVNCAGIYGPMGPLEDTPWDDWTRAIEVNLYGSVLTARAVIPHFKARRHGKIVQLSGGGATAPMARFSAYAASKAGVVRFAETLADELREFGIDVNSIAPGGLNTRMLDEVLEAGPERVGEDFFQRMVQQKADGGVPLDVGAALVVFLASAASDGITGKLISAPWDAWQDLPLHLEELSRSDVYTLRRIVPADRGLDW
jgi:NAD(P)-dependent dehydrogenase (short-subunit alcohol dehydrogenase family)